MGALQYKEEIYFVTTYVIGTFILPGEKISILYQVNFVQIPALRVVKVNFDKRRKIQI